MTGTIFSRYKFVPFALAQASWRQPKTETSLLTVSSTQVSRLQISSRVVALQHVLDFSLTGFKGPAGMVTQLANESYGAFQVALAIVKVHLLEQLGRLCTYIEEQ